MEQTRRRGNLSAADEIFFALCARKLRLTPRANSTGPSCTRLLRKNPADFSAGFGAEDEIRAFGGAPRLTIINRQVCGNLFCNRTIRSQTARSRSRLHPRISLIFCLPQKKRDEKSSRFFWRRRRDSNSCCRYPALLP